MKIKWLGHASFLITSEGGVKILTDPYASGGDLKYGEIRESADIVTVSHDHSDHNNVASVRGNPKVVTGSAKVGGIEFKAVPTFHDEEGGTARGKNNVFCFVVDKVKVCHIGDLGHKLTDKQAAEIGQIDVLLIPVGGYYTIDAKVATEVSHRLKPKVIIPMHFRNERCAMPLTGVDDFLAGKKDVTRLNASETEIKADKLPATTQVIVLKPAL